jgi:hypothetical protein
LSVAVLVAAGALFLQTLLAVHFEGFELDGNISNDADAPVAPPPPGQIDWAQIFNSAGVPFDPLPAGFTHAGFKRDFLQNANGSFNTSDPTTYATGSKDTLPISGWQCTRSNNVTSKDDIINAYAVAYRAGGEDFLYFGLERDANTGDANVGFWFLQGAVDCNSPGGSTDFTGEHQDGDLLIVSEFSNGGTVSTVNVYRWDGDDATGSLNPVAVATGDDCRTGAQANDEACAAANTAGITGIPWLTSNTRDGVGHALREAEFFEAGLNLTLSGLGGKCFNTFIANTRSSTSLTATIFDYARGVIGECASTTVTTPSVASPTTIPASGTLNVTDSATVTVDGATSFTGEVEFHLCGPFAADATTRCTTGGVAAGTKPLTANGTVVSDTMTITSAGRYCWRADFSASDPTGIPPSSDSRESECFLINPRTAGLVTQAGAGPVDFGQQVTDTATLSNTANQEGSGGPTGSTNGSINPTVPGAAAGGTITFTLFKSDCTTVATGTGTNPQVVTVSGDGTYGPVSFTPDAPGTYHWFAQYSGDLPNTVGNSHNGACDQTAESVVVRTIPTTIKTKQSWIPNDTATITSTIGNLAAGGSVAFSLYANPTCAGSSVFSQTLILQGGAPSEEVSTTNTTSFKVLTGYTDPPGSVVAYSWKVVYTPAATDTAHTGKQSACNAENHTITYTNDPGPGTNLP